MRWARFLPATDPRYTCIPSVAAVSRHSILQCGSFFLNYQVELKSTFLTLNWLRIPFPFLPSPPGVTQSCFLPHTTFMKKLLSAPENFAANKAIPMNTGHHIHLELRVQFWKETSHKEWPCWLGSLFDFCDIHSSLLLGRKGIFSLIVGFANGPKFQPHSSSSYLLSPIRMLHLEATRQWDVLTTRESSPHP